MSEMAAPATGAKTRRELDRAVIADANTPDSVQITHQAPVVNRGASCRCWSQGAFHSA